MSFLHAYLRCDCREMASTKQPTITLVPKVSPLAWDKPPTISDIIAPLKGIASEQQHPSDVLFRYLVAKLSQSTVLRLSSKSVVIVAR